MNKQVVLCGFLLMVLIVATHALPKSFAEPKSCPENEFYTECGDACQTECSRLGEPCNIAYFRCPDGCYCNKGYARNGSGKCIPIDNCPK